MANDNSSQPERKTRERKVPPLMVPEPVPGEPDFVTVDTTWGEIQPMQPSAGVQAIGEKELLDLMAEGVPVVDGRTRELFEASTLPGAASVPFDEAVDRREELEPHEQVVFFCNGPQCGQSTHGHSTAGRCRVPD